MGGKNCNPYSPTLCSPFLAQDRAARLLFQLLLLACIPSLALQLHDWNNSIWLGSPATVLPCIASQLHGKEIVRISHWVPDPLLVPPSKVTIAKPHEESCTSGRFGSNCQWFPRTSQNIKGKHAFNQCCFCVLWSLWIYIFQSRISWNISLYYKFIYFPSTSPRIHGCLFAFDHVLGHQSLEDNISSDGDGANENLGQESTGASPPLALHFCGCHLVAITYTCVSKHTW